MRLFRVINGGKRHQVLSTCSGASNFKAVQNEFNKQATTFEADWNVRSRTTTKSLMQKVMMHVAPHLPKSESLHALDVACGTGIFTRALISHGDGNGGDLYRTFTGLDATANMLSKARAAVQDLESDVDIKFLQGDAASMPFEDNSFDLVACRLAIHHFQDPIQQMQEMSRVCRPGGLVIIVDICSPESSHLANSMNELERMRDPSHTVALSPVSLAQLVEDSGLHICSTRAETKGCTVQLRSGTKNIPFFYNEMFLSKWLDSTLTPPARRKVIESAVEKELHKGGGNEDPEATGLYPFVVEDGEICFTHRYVVICATKAA